MPGAGVGNDWAGELGGDWPGLGVAARGEAGLGVVGLGVVGLGVVGLGVVGLGVPLAETVGVAGLVAPGENGGGVVDGEPPEQADTDALASSAKAAPLRTVRRERRRPQK